MTAGSWGEVARKLLGRGLGAGGPPSPISTPPVILILPFPTPNLLDLQRDACYCILHHTVGPSGPL